MAGVNETAVWSASGERVKAPEKAGGRRSFAPMETQRGQSARGPIWRPLKRSVD